MKLTRKLAALAMAVLLAVSLTACSPKEWAQNVVVNLGEISMYLISKLIA